MWLVNFSITVRMANVNYYRKQWSKNVRNEQQQYLPKQLIENIGHLLGINFLNTIGRLYTSFIFIGFCYCVYMARDAICDVKCNHILIIELVMKLQYFGNSIFVLSILGSSLLKPTQFQLSRQHLFKIDRTISTFNVNLKSNYTFRLQLFLLFITPLLVSAHSIYDNFYDYSIKEMCFTFQLWYSSILMVMMDYLFINYLTIIRERFCKVNEILIKQKNSNILSSEAVFVVIRDQNNHVDDFKSLSSPLRMIQFLHHELCCLLRKVNSGFNIHLFMASCVSFISILGQTYQLQKALREHIQQKDLIFSLCFSVSFYLLRMMRISYACENLMDELNSTMLLIHDTSVRGQPFKNTVVQFSLQMIHENIKITGFEFFELNIGIIRSVRKIILIMYINRQFINHLIYKLGIIYWQSTCSYIISIALLPSHTVLSYLKSSFSRFLVKCTI
ncbi:uncharacterized protein [Prorops nasuta]|uniref:uncharacterized protein n=1 Tax=Prorops nasuta TaxID=863751 RepID=UPI0034CD9544